MVRMSAEERRESVIRAATAEFARGGYHGTSTEAIAKRVGVSQPYLFRLFPGKKAIFLAAAERCVEDTIRIFAEAAEGLEGEEALHAMADAYTELIAERPERLLMQMQMYVAVAAAEEDGRPRVRRGGAGRLDAAVGHRPPAARRRRRRDDDLPGVRDAHQLPGGHGLPARAPGLGRACTRRRGSRAGWSTEPCGMGVVGRLSMIVKVSDQ